MISLTHHREKAFLIVGLGKSGFSAARALTAAGADVRVWDDGEAQRDKAATEGFGIFDIETGDMAALDGVIWSPGVPHTYPAPHPLAVKARAAGHTLQCDVDLLATAQLKATFVGITGTNGKSTTTALTAHVLKSSGYEVEVGGNLGYTALDLAPLGAGGIYVLELSSYQTELTPNLHCATAVLLNITPDHLDRHNGLDGYVAAKAQLFENQDAGSTAILGQDDEPCQAVTGRLTKEGRLNVVQVSADSKRQRGVTVTDGLLTDGLFGDGDMIDLRGLKTLPGKHNWQNAAAAYTIARQHGATAAAIEAAFRTFPGLAHRQEVVGSSHGVTFVNDSKATNADATEKALSCYSSVYWIAGGVAKAGGITTLGPLFGRIQHAFLIGETANDFATTLTEAGVAVSVHSSLQDATAQAGELAFKADDTDSTVLLSPACASFDMFANFEERGDVFRNTVQELWPEVVQ